jgi:hypothetical protein
MAKAKKRKSLSRRCERWGILNRYGELWSPMPFESERKARDHLEDYWKNFPCGPHSTKHFKIVPVRVTVTPM